ncbi:MAG: hypothetical protein ABJE95_28640 [Byssovorax sp.]
MDSINRTLAIFTASMSSRHSWPVAGWCRPSFLCLLQAAPGLHGSATLTSGSGLRLQALERMRLQTLAEIRRLIESPVAPCGTAAEGKIEAAMRELEAFLAARDGNGAPPDAMVDNAPSGSGSWARYRS